jgi:hypothetical protein
MRQLNSGTIHNCEASAGHGTSACPHKTSISIRAFLGFGTSFWNDLVGCGPRRPLAAATVRSQAIARRNAWSRFCTSLNVNISGQIGDQLKQRIQ